MITVRKSYSQNLEAVISIEWWWGLFVFLLSRALCFFKVSSILPNILLSKCLEVISWMMTLNWMFRSFLASNLAREMLSWIKSLCSKECTPCHKVVNVDIEDSSFFTSMDVDFEKYIQCFCRGLICHMVGICHMDSWHPKGVSQQPQSTLSQCLTVLMRQQVIPKFIIANLFCVIEVYSTTCGSCYCIIYHSFLWFSRRMNMTCQLFLRDCNQCTCPSSL